MAHSTPLATTAHSLSTRAEGDVGRGGGEGRGGGRGEQPSESKDNERKRNETGEERGGKCVDTCATNMSCQDPHLHLSDSPFCLAQYTPAQHHVNAPRQATAAADTPTHSSIPSWRDRRLWELGSGIWGLGAWGLGVPLRSIISSCHADTWSKHLVKHLVKTDTWSKARDDRHLVKI